jgi:HAD superfamily hydrolase (TIGR01549 family)
MRYRALVFDLFGTVVLFNHRVPTLQVGGTTWRSTMGWLQDAVERELPGVALDDFVNALTAATEEIVRGRHPAYYEVPSRERFRRALARLGRADAAAAAMAERLSLAHMAHLAAQTETPNDYAAVLQRLRRSFALGLVSNFDHGPTALAVLERNRIDDAFTATVISAYFGRRKPHPDIFHEALRQLGVSRGEALFVGDTLDDDVAGARAAGMDVVWINAHAVERSPDAPAPTYTIACLTDLPAVLGLDR